MAVTDYNNLTATTRDKILPKIEDVISSSRPFLRHLFKTAEKRDGGKTIQKTIRYKQGTQGKWYTGLEVLNSGQDTTTTRAQWDWNFYSNPIVLSNPDIAKNGGTEKVFDLLKTTMEDIALTTEEDLATDSFGDGTGDDSKAFLGLVAAVDDGTNIDTYGSITRSSYSWWKSYYNATGGTLALATMATAFDGCSDGEKEPKMILTTKALWTAYEGLLEPSVRLNFTTTGYPIADGGFKTLHYRGTPIMKDSHCTSGYMYFLNTDYIKLQYLAHPNATSKGAKCLFMSDMLTPPNQDGQLGYVFLYGNIINTDPQRSGVIRGLS